MPFVNKENLGKKKNNKIALKMSCPSSLQSVVKVACKVKIGYACALRVYSNSK